MIAQQAALQRQHHGDGGVDHVGHVVARHIRDPDAALSAGSGIDPIVADPEPRDDLAVVELGDHRGIDIDDMPQQDRVAGA